MVRYEDAVVELMAAAVRLAREAGRTEPNAARQLLTMALAEIRDEGLMLTLTPTTPVTAPGTELKKVFLAWYAETYGAVYDWGVKEAVNAKRLMGKAGERGVGEVIRRAEIAAGQSWRTSAVTLGTLVDAWNSLAAEVAPKAAETSGDRLRRIASEMRRRGQ